MSCKLSYFLFADDTVLVSDSMKALQEIVDEFEKMCFRRKLRVNVDKSKVMRICKDRMKVSIRRIFMDEDETFRYLGVDIRSDGEEMNHRVIEARKSE